tara:strand:- start:434 stop:1843 length:1410 start_codon:yes stop_codon:yes gene_type:complete
MDEHIYPKTTIDKFLNENLLFKDAKMKKYYDRNLQRDLGKFRSRAHTTHRKKDFEKIMYVLVTDCVRDIIIETVGEVSEHMKNMGDVIVSGGEAFNLYVDYNQRIVTSDIDAKFVPRMSVNPQYFGKLQATKLILWDKLGEIAKRLGPRIKKRLISMRKKYPKIFKFLGISFKQASPVVTRRYTLIKKKKMGSTNKPNKGDVFIDVELFALDMNIRYFSPESGKIEDFNIGGILDIPFMRPKEFGYEVVLSRRKGITYRNLDSGKLKTNNKVYIASKEFLIEDIYLMQKLKLRPEKKEKDRQRLIKLARLFDKRIKGTDSMEDVFKKVRSKIVRKGPAATKKNARVSMNQAKRVDPSKYKNYTTKPSDERLSKQMVFGFKSAVKNTKVNGYEKSSGNKQFNVNTLKWKNVTNNSYVKNEYNFRPKNSKNLPKNFNVSNTLYGYKPRRNMWVEKNVLNKSAAIPFVGLKK